MKKIKERPASVKKKDVEPESEPQSFGLDPLEELKKKLAKNSVNPLGYEELDEAFRIALNKKLSNK